MAISVKKKHMNETKITKYEDRGNSVSNSLRLVLHWGEVYRLLQTAREIQVLSGHAWLTMASQDVILSPGEKAAIAPDKVFGLVSVLGDEPLVFDITLNSSERNE